MIVLHPTGRCKQHSGGSGGGGGRGDGPSYFKRPNGGPKGRKKCLGGRPPTYLRIWMTISAVAARENV